MSKAEDNLNRLGIRLPAAPKPIASYVPYVIAGKMVFISGQLPSRDGQIVFKGRLPDEVTVEQGQEAAKLAVINALAVLQKACEGDFKKVDRVVRMGVFVQSENSFKQQSAIANGASDLLMEVFGETGRHVRAAVGVNALPLGATVELELIVQLK